MPVGGGVWSAASEEDFDGCGQALEEALLFFLLFFGHGAAKPLFQVLFLPCPLCAVRLFLQEAFILGKRCDLVAWLRFGGRMGRNFTGDGGGGAGRLGSPGRG